MRVEIVFDPIKRETNLKVHPGFDFVDLDVAFFNRAVVVPAKRNRLMAIGRFGDGVISVIFSPLGTEAISVISMRTASKKERKAMP